MDKEEDPRKLEFEIERATRLAASTTDRTTYDRLKGFVEELRERLRRRKAEKQTREEIRHLAHETLGAERAPNGPGC